MKSKTLSQKSVHLLCKSVASNSTLIDAATAIKRRELIRISSFFYKYILFLFIYIFDNKINNRKLPNKYINLNKIYL